MPESASASAAVRERAMPLARRLWWLIAGRLLVALLLIGVALWSPAWFEGAGREAFRGVWVFAGGALALSALYAVMRRFTSLPLRAQAGAQLLVDVLLVTWLVWATGDLRSPYVALYILIISVVGLFLGARGALVTSVGCATSYLSLSFAVALGWIAPYGSSATAGLGEVAETAGLNIIAFFFVGLLAAQLAARQSAADAQLEEATHELANLRALHERIVESIRSGVITTDFGGRIYTFNAAAEEITGYRAADVRGQNASILFGHLADQIEQSMRAATTGEPSPRFEANCLTPDGLRAHLGFSIFPLHDEAGQTTGLVITFQDLTEVRALEETSRRQDRLAAVGRVAAGIAHEIRNPLASMRGSIQVLRSELDKDSQQAELMEIILRESDRLNQIITDFLTYARPRVRSFAEVDVREPLRETFTLLRHSPELRAGHLLEEDLPAAPVPALADAAALKQVFWNLARNALQAMPDGGSLRAAITPALPNGRLRITFSDTGRGMSPEQVERLFEPFSSSTGGTGLGLSIVYQIIRDHGGTINVRSLEGEGTSIAVELPSAVSVQQSAISQAATPIADGKAES